MEYSVLNCSLMIFSINLYCFYLNSKRLTEYIKEFSKCHRSGYSLSVNIRIPYYLFLHLSVQMILQLMWNYSKLASLHRKRKEKDLYHFIQHNRNSYPSFFLYVQIMTYSLRQQRLHVSRLQSLNDLVEKSFVTTAQPVYVFSYSFAYNTSLQLSGSQLSVLQ